MFGRQINWATPEPQHLRLVTTPQHEEDMALAEAWLRDGDAYSRLREAALFALREYESYIETREAAIEQREQQMDELRTKIHNLI